MNEAFSHPPEKVWRHGPEPRLPKNEIVWFFVSSHDGINQECLTGIILECMVIDVGRKDGLKAEVYVIRIGAEEWFVSASRCFEYWEDCDREARTYTRWAKQIRRSASEHSNSRW